MKTSYTAAAAGMLAGITLLLSTAPAMAHPHIGLAVSVGVPLAPVAVVAPGPVYVPAVPAPVVYGGYGPVVSVGGPLFYRGREWHDFRGYRGWHR